MIAVGHVRSIWSVVAAAGVLGGKRTISFVTLDLTRADCTAGCGRDASERAERVETG